MRVPQVTERIKEAPVVVLRGMLAGIGQVLLITDKLRNKPASAPEGAAPEGAAPQAPADAAPAPAAPAPAAPAPAAPAPAASKTVAPEAAAAAAEGAAEVAEAVPGADASTETVEAATGSLPLENYDQLTVPSLRARLRTLTAAQVAELAEYERSHAARAEVITMFERRIAKLTAES